MAQRSRDEVGRTSLSHSALSARYRFGPDLRTPIRARDCSVASEAGQTSDPTCDAMHSERFCLRSPERSLIASPLSMAFCFLLLPYRGHGSLRGRKRPPQHLVRSTSAAMSTTGSHGVFMWPKALLRSRLHPRPVGQPLHPRRRFGCISVKHSLGGHRLLGPTEWLA